MALKSRLCVAAALAGAVALMAPFAGAPAPGRSLEKGWLLLDGGGALPGPTARRFVELAGGAGARVVIIPTAQPDENIDADEYRDAMAGLFGGARLTVLHTRDREVANSDRFVEPLRQAGGVWFGGGRQWRLADAYLGTAVEREINALLARGGVVGGASAGATFQGSLLIRGQPGPPFNPDGDNTVMLAPGHETGLGFLENTAVDQHIDTRHRLGDLEPVVAAHPGLLGIGLDEGAAIVVHGGAFEVMGGRVTIYDGQLHDGALHYFLGPGAVFDLAGPSSAAGRAQ